MPPWLPWGPSLPPAPSAGAWGKLPTLPLAFELQPRPDGHGTRGIVTAITGKVTAGALGTQQIQCFSRRVHLYLTQNAPLGPPIQGPGPLSLCQSGSLCRRPRDGAYKGLSLQALWFWSPQDGGELTQFRATTGRCKAGPYNRCPRDIRWMLPDNPGAEHPACLTMPWPGPASGSRAAPCPPECAAHRLPSPGGGCTSEPCTPRGCTRLPCP